MKIKSLILCLINLIISGVSQASMTKLMVKHVAQHRKVYGLLLIGAFGFNEYRNHTCKRAFVSLKKSGSGLFNKSKKDDADAKIKAQQAALAAEAAKRVTDARAAEALEQEYATAEAAFNAGTLTDADKPRLRALMAQLPPARQAALQGIIDLI